MNTKKEMKRYNHYIAWLFALTLTFSACDKIEPDFFNGDYNGAYFDYQYASDYETTVNFGEHIIGNPQEVPVVLNVKLLGYLKDESRSLSIKAKEVEDYPLAEVVIPDVTFANQEYQKGVEVLVKRPEVENEVFAVCIYLDGEGDLGTGINGKEEYTIYVKEVHEAPSVWSDNMVQTYLGDWNREKHAFLANLTNNNYYYNAFIKNDEINSNEIKDLSILAVHALLAEEPTEPITINIPIVVNNSDDEQALPYKEPYFWKEFSDSLVMFNPKRFNTFNRLIKTVTNTTDVIAAYNSDIATELINENKEKYNKSDVLTMLDEYYKYPKAGYTIDQYKDLSWVKIEANANYTGYLRIPYWWEDPDNLGTGDVVKALFGEYNEEKYKFIIKTIIEKEGEDDFVAASILPFVITENGFGWDETAGGKERLKECYNLIIKKAAATILHKIPKVDPDEILSQY